MNDFRVITLSLGREFQLYRSLGVDVRLSAGIYGTFRVSEFAPRYRGLDEFSRCAKLPSELHDYCLVLILNRMYDEAFEKLRAANETAARRFAKKTYRFLYPENTNNKIFELTGDELDKLIMNGFQKVQKAILGTQKEIDEIRYKKGLPSLQTFVESAHRELSA